MLRAAGEIRNAPMLDEPEAIAAIECFLDETCGHDVA
jgi:hypothetical protein